MVEGNGLDSITFAVVAGVGCVLMGVLYARTLSRRVHALTAWARVLSKIEAGLGWRAHTLEGLITRAADGEVCRDVCEPLWACAERMREDPMLTLADAITPDKLPAMTDADLAALSPLWAGLGEGNEDAQRGLLRSVRAALAAQVDAAAQDEQKNRRLYLSLGGIGGLMVFLFLL